MRLSQIVTVSALVFVMGSGICLAQTPNPAAPAPTTAADADKKAISKACSDQANAQGLHGKKRKTFRYECKKNGGKAT
jgi:psiF repeat